MHVRKFRKHPLMYIKRRVFLSSKFFTLVRILRMSNSHKSLIYDNITYKLIDFQSINNNQLTIVVQGSYKIFFFILK